MRRLVIGGLVGVDALTLGSLVLLDRLTRDGGPDRPIPSAAAPPRAPTAPPPAPQLPAGLQGKALFAPDTGGLTARDFDRMADRGPALVPAPPGSWEAVPIVSNRTRAMEPALAGVARGLVELQDGLAACFDPAEAARVGAATFTRVKDAEPQDEAGTTLLVLELELSANQARVVDAPVEATGDASEATLACLQAALRGKTFEAPGAKPGERRRLQHRVIP